MKPEHQLAQIDRLTRPMESKFARAYHRFIEVIRPKVVANVKNGGAPDAASFKGKLPKAFSRIYRADIEASRAQANKQIATGRAAKPKDFNPDQPRDASGRWGSGAGAAVADTDPAAGGHEHSGAYEQGTVKPKSPRPEVEWRKEAPSPEAFIEARGKSKHEAFLSPLTAEELKGSELHLSADGKVGYAITKDGDFGNLFNNGGPKGAGQTAVIRAIESGKVKTADCFNGYLPELYTNFGLTATSAMKFNDDYAPPGWNYKNDDRPDVLFLSFTGGDPETIASRVGTFGSFKHPRKWSDDYDAAKAESKRRAVAHGVSGKSADLGGVRLRGVHAEPDRGSGDRVGEGARAHAPVAGGVYRLSLKARRSRLSDLEEGASREVGVAGTRRLPYATGATFDVDDLIEESLARLGGTLDTLDDRLEAVLADAPEDLTDEELADLLEEEFDAFEDDGKIESIAETEVFGSVNGGRAQAFAESEVEWGLWATMEDNKVREYHRDFGQSGVHPMGFNYAKLTDTPETLLRWPHDVECEEPSLVCNCRCALLWTEPPDNAAEIYDEEMGDLGDDDEDKLFDAEERLRRLRARRTGKDFDPNQPRDESGKWTGDGGGSGGGGAEGEAGGGAAAPAPPEYQHAATREEAEKRALTRFAMPDEEYAKATAHHDEQTQVIKDQFDKDVKGAREDLRTAQEALNAASRERQTATSDLRTAERALEAEAARLGLPVPAATAPDAEKAPFVGLLAAEHEAFLSMQNATAAHDLASDKFTEASNAQAAIVEQRDAAYNELDARMGADYWATHYDTNKDEFEVTMDELRGSWRHIGSMGNKVDPIAFRFATETAFGIEGIAYDAKAKRIIDRDEYADEEGRMTKWAGAMRLEYEDTQDELRSDVEWESGERDSQDLYEEWTESDSYQDSYNDAQQSAWNDMSVKDKIDYLDDKEKQEGYEWASENIEKVEEEAPDYAPKMEETIAQNDVGYQNSEEAIAALKQAGIEVDYDPNQGRLEGIAPEPPTPRERAIAAEVMNAHEEAQSLLDKSEEVKAEAARQRSEMNRDLGWDPLGVPAWQWPKEINGQPLTPQDEIRARGWIDRVGALNREAKKLEELSGEKAQESIDSAISLMELADKYPGGRTREQVEEAHTERMDEWIGEHGLKAYVADGNPGEDEAKQHWYDTSDFEYDDSEDFSNWSQNQGGGGGSGDPFTISPGDWPLEMTRNVNAKEQGYVKNYAESWALRKEQHGFGSTTLREKINREHVLVFQGAKHWRAVAMGLTEAEFIVLSQLPFWKRKTSSREAAA